MYEYFQFSNLSITDQIGLYSLVCRNFENQSLSFERFRSKHLGYIGSSFGYLFRDKNKVIRGWRAYLPLIQCSKKIVHLAGVDACVDDEFRGQGVLLNMTQLTFEKLDFPCIVYGYPNLFNKSYDASHFCHLAYFSPSIHSTKKAQNLVTEQRALNQLQIFKSTFLSHYKIHNRVLTRHPSKSFALVDQMGPTSFNLTFKCLLRKKIVIYYNETSKKTNLRQVAKAFNCELIENAIVGVEFCDFL